MGRPIFSVVVPVLNRAHTVRRCLDSIFSQNHQVEVVVIDGGSTDGTLEFIKQYQEQLTYFETGEDQGIVDAFNRGVSRCSGEWIAILNSDDWWEPGALSYVHGRAKNSAVPRVIHGQCRMHGENSSYIKLPVMKDMRKYMSAYHTTMFIHQDIYKLVGPYDESYSLAMDAEWVHRALSQAVKFEAIDTVLSNMSLGGVSDANAFSALKQYRKSVISHELAPQWYANLYFFTHACIRVGYLVPGFSRIKRMIDRLFNASVVHQ